MRKFVTCVLLSAAGSFPAAADDPPVSLHIDAPSSNGGLALLSESGWPITVKLNIELPPPPEEGQPVPFPAYAVRPDFPAVGQAGFLIFDDPDGCLNPPWDDWLVDFFDPDCTTPPQPSDETYLEFWLDVDLAGAADPEGNPDRQADLLDPNSSGGPEFDRWSNGVVLACMPDTNDPNCNQFGPDTGGETTDGFGIGANDDLPGLVVIAQYGIGNTYNEPVFEQTSPVGARNLAGLVNSVSYDLSDLEKSNGKPPKSLKEFSRIWAHLNMPPGVVRHIIQYDACVGEITYQDPPFETEIDHCEPGELWRVDGGPIETAPMDYGRPDAASVDLLNSTVFELRAFLLAGQAPNELSDLTGDGVVDSEDAVAAGYTLLSNEDSIEFLQLSQFLCFGGGLNAVYFDLDGNGEAFVQETCGAGPGDLGRPPR